MVAGALEAEQAGLTRRQLAGLVLAPLVGIVLWFLPTHESLVAQRAIAIAAVTIVLWITEAVDHATAGFIGLTAYWASGVGTLGQIFSGFAGETPWFLMGALLIGSMAAEIRSGPAHRVQRHDAEPAIRTPVFCSASSSSTFCSRSWCRPASPA